MPLAALKGLYAHFSSVSYRSCYNTVRRTLPSAARCPRAPELCSPPWTTPTMPPTTTATTSHRPTCRPSAEQLQKNEKGIDHGTFPVQERTESSRPSPPVAQRETRFATDCSVIDQTVTELRVTDTQSQTTTLLRSATQQRSPVERDREALNRTWMLSRRMIRRDRPESSTSHPRARLSLLF